MVNGERVKGKCSPSHPLTPSTLDSPESGNLAVAVGDEHPFQDCSCSQMESDRNRQLSEALPAQLPQHGCFLARCS